MDSSCIIAEIGTSHGGDLVKALEMIHAAKESGADTAKFQWVYADEIIHRNTGVVKLPTGTIPLYERFRSLEKGPDFFGTLKAECEKLGIEFLCTPFGVRSALELWGLGVRRFKIASPELNHIPLLELLGASGAELIVSSGVSRLADIEEALETIAASRSGHFSSLPTVNPGAHREVVKRMRMTRQSQETKYNAVHGSRAAITLLHCMTAYPAPEDEYNLLLVKNLRIIFGVQTGISDHSMDPILVPVVSTILGGTIIEKHFTLSNDSDGLDDPIALNPVAFRSMVDAVHSIQGKNGSPENLTGTPAEYVWKSLANTGITADFAHIARIVGDGVKVLAPTERDNYGRTNRSVHANRSLKAGTILSPEDISIVRSEKILRPGIHPRHAAQIIGKHLKTDVADGEGIRWQDLID